MLSHYSGDAFRTKDSISKMVWGSTCGNLRFNATLLGCFHFSLTRGCWCTWSFKLMLNSASQGWNPICCLSSCKALALAQKIKKKLNELTPCPCYITNCFWNFPQKESTMQQKTAWFCFFNEKESHLGLTELLAWFSRASPRFPVVGKGQPSAGNRLLDMNWRLSCCKSLKCIE